MVASRAHLNYFAVVDDDGVVAGVQDNDGAGRPNRVAEVLGRCLPGTSGLGFCRLGGTFA